MERLWALANMGELNYLNFSVFATSRAELMSIISQPIDQLP